MKALTKISGVLLLPVALLMTNCTANSVQVSGSLAITTTLSKAIVQPAPTGINLLSAKIQLQHLRIEENSGNNSQNTDSNTSDTETTTSAETDNGDALLAGPYILDLLSGTATIDSVSLRPGVYRQVDFDFVPNRTNVHSIEITGTVNNNGVNVPFVITSDIASTVQLPLAGSGITVTSGIRSKLSIVFNIKALLQNVNFKNATISNNTININSNENVSLYSSFITALSGYITTEKN